MSDKITKQHAAYNISATKIEDQMILEKLQASMIPFTGRVLSLPSDKGIELINRYLVWVKDVKEYLVSEPLPKEPVITPV